MQAAGRTRGRTGVDSGNGAGDVAPAGTAGAASGRGSRSATKYGRAKATDPRSNPRLTRLAPKRGPAASPGRKAGKAGLKPKRPESTRAHKRYTAVPAAAEA